MSEMIVQVRNKILRRIGGVNHFVSHNKDYTIQFQFDESWNNVRTKMAVFAYEDGEYGSEIFDGDTCNVPELPKEGRILIGVKAGEDLSTELLCIPVCKSADDVITDEYDEPDPKIYEQILDIINNLWNGGTTVYPSPVKFLASPSTAKVGDLIRVKEVDENGDVTRTEGFDVGVELEKKINAPQVAKVGEVLTVEEVDADGKPKKWKAQTVETAPPDWMENVSNNPGFVKNRTHYKQMMAGPAGNPGYKVNLLDGTHRVGDIILLQSLTTNSLQKFLMQGINSPDWGEYELCMLIKETDSNGKTYNLEVICKDSENIVEVNTLSEGNIKVLYSEQAKAFLAYYFISNLSTLSTDDKTKFTQTGVYVQLVGNDYSEYAELWATYRLYLYTKLSNKYLNIRQDPPDWNENDPTKPGYIKNRPFYESSEEFIGSIEFTATSENTMKRVISIEDMSTLEGIVSLSGAGPILKAYVDGQTCMSSIIFDYGIISISGALNGMSDFQPGGNFNVTINKDGLVLVPNKTYIVKFYNANGPFYKTISENFFPDTIFSQKNAPVKFGASNSGELINSTVQGDRTKASGNCSHAEGGQTEASSEYSHAEGDNTKASGYGSHAEGYHTEASGHGSHAECGFSKASSEYSHAEGYHTEASGYGSHAEGDNTVANKKFLSVSGSYNLYDDVKYVQSSYSDTLVVMSNDTYYESDSFTFDASTGIFTLVEPVARKGPQLHLNKFCMFRDVSGDIVYKLISIKESLNNRVYYDVTKYTSILASNSKDQYSTIVGNGTSDTERSNAYTLDWEGNAWFAGNIYVGSTSGTNKDDGSKKLLDTSDLLAFEEKVKDITIQKPTTAQVRQIIKVKAVDAGGKITETEAVDMSTIVSVTYDEETGNLQIGD